MYLLLIKKSSKATKREPKVKKSPGLKPEQFFVDSAESTYFDLLVLMTTD